ncbi:lipocalin family protein [Aurantimonas marianensis]|uniref:AttH domain-containing protein n=1 Tax=Aurantimonas marianensis TaxID=2920428 RepID=A0A9X2H9Z6_9HYPH|nr:lipocalin family protein [Aurantimonas marianensis]MCP3056971.1 hypothetical protein [Aurantimonas marianensis]
MPTSFDLNASGSVPNLLPVAGAELQWWFVQGHVAGDDAPAVHFMAAFFVINGVARAAPEPAHMLLLHILDGATTPHVVSRITPAVAAVHRAWARTVAQANYAPALASVVLRRHLADVESSASEGGIDTRADGAWLGTDTFAIHWDGFAFAATDGGFELALPTGANGAARLRLEPQRPWMDEDGGRLDPAVASPYRYICCPRLAVSGEIGGRQVNGHAWIDRQWGALDRWLLVRGHDGIQLSGWDWLGLTLEDGTDFLIQRGYTVGAGPLGNGFVVRFDKRSARLTPGGFAPAPHGYWTSHRSGARYPVARRVLLPAEDGVIDVVPVRRDQEIPVYGASAIWEGAVTASGHLAGREVAGHGRLELFGYGYADTVARYLARRMRRGFGG